MKVIFLGTGEAFDENNPNDSVLIIKDKTTLLLDCGYDIPKEIWKYNDDTEFLDYIFISHSHADHYFGLPPLLVRMWEDNRIKPINIICEKNVKKDIIKLLELGYQGFSQKFRFKINFILIETFKKININGLELDFADTIHSKYNLAIKITDNNKSVCYSGDGMFNENTVKLYKNSNLLIQETYLLDQEKIGHATINNTIKMAKENNIDCLALTHINRNLRKDDIKKIKDIIKKEKIKIIIPEPLEEILI
jgi:ribonuclease Z